ncbi:MAG: GLUG motif-containing protein [Spirochaetales bacterium]
MNTMKKLTIIIAMILLTTSGILFGCDTLYSKMSLQLDKESITLYLDSPEYVEGEENGETSTGYFTATINNLPKDVVNNLVVSQTTVGIVDVVDYAKNEENNSTTFELIAVNPGTSQITVMTEEGAKKATLTVNIVKKITGMELNENYSQVVVNGTPSAINTASAIKFLPLNTNQKGVTYSLGDTYGGVSITPAGILTATTTYYTPITVVATSVSDSNIYVEIPIKITDAVADEDISLYYDAAIVSEVVLATNNITYSQGNYTVTINNTVEDYNIVLTSQNGQVLEVEKLNYNEFMLRSISLGNTTVTARAELIGYEDFYIEKTFNVRVIEFPSYVNINGQLSTLGISAEVFDDYVNNLGQPFVLNVGAVGAYNKTIKLSMDAEDTEKIMVSYSDGTPVDFENDILPNGTVIYVRAIADPETGDVATGGVTITVYAYATIEMDEDAIFGTLNLTLSKGADDINVVVETNTVSSISMQVGDQIGEYVEFTLTASPATSSLGTIYYNVVNSSVISCTYNEESGIYRVVGLTSGSAQIVITSANGISKTINVTVYNILDDYTLNIYTPEQSSNVAEVNKTTGTHPTLTNVTIAAGAGLPILLTKYPSDATVVRVNYQSSNPLVASVSTSGYIVAKALGTTTITVKLYTNVPKLDEFGEEILGQSVEVEEVRSFILNTYVPIQQMQLNYYQYELLDSQTLGYFDTNSSKLQLAATISPINATFTNNDVIWTSSNSYATVDENGLVTASIPAEIELARTTITATIIEYGRYYVQKCVITITRATRAQDISVLNVDENGLYFDAREGLGEENAATNSFKLNAQVYPVNADNTDIVYKYVADPSDETPSVPVVIIRADGTVIPNKAGRATIYVIAKDSYTSATAYTKYTRISVRVADGLSEATAIEISSAQDLFNMNTTEGLTLHYVLTSTIDLTGLDYTSIGVIDGIVVGFSGTLNGRYEVPSSGKIVDNQIMGLNINQTNSIRTNYYGLFALLNGGTIKNVRLKVTSLVLNLSNNTSTSASYIGGLVGKNDGGTIDNVSVQILNSSIEVANAKNYIGGIVGYNNGTVTNTSSLEGFDHLQVSGKLKVYRRTSITYTPVIYIGGMVGYNYGSSTISGKFDPLSETLIDNFADINSNIEVILTYDTNSLSAVGGLVGYNVGNISGLSSNSSVNGYYNVGGAVGYNNGGTITGVFESGLVNGEINVGGLVGQNSGSIINSMVIILDKYDLTATTTPQIIGVNNVGGLIGNSVNSTVTNSYVKSFYTRALDANYEGDLIVTVADGYSQAVYVGGLVGLVDRLQATRTYADLNIKVKYAGSVTGNIYAGGLVAYNNGLTNITDSFAKGTINATTNSYVGGIAGRFNGVSGATASIIKTYSTMALTGTNKGGTVGNVNTINGSVTISHNFYLEGTGIDNGYGTSKTITELRTQSTYEAETFTFVNSVPNSAWNINIEYNDATPYLMYDDATQMLIQAPTDISVSINAGIESLVGNITGDDILNNHFKLDNSKAVVYYYSGAGSAVNTYSLDKVGTEYGSPIITKSFVPANTTPGWIMASSSDITVANVSEDGLIYVYKSGVVTITVYSILDRNVYDEFELAVVNAVNTFMLYREDLDTTETDNFTALNTSADEFVMPKNSVARLYPILQTIIDGTEYSVNPSVYLNYQITNTLISDLENYVWGVGGVDVSASEANVIEGLSSGSAVFTITPQISIQFAGSLEDLSLTFLQREFTITVVEGSTSLDIDTAEASISLKDIFVVTVQVNTDIPSETVIAVQEVTRDGEDATGEVNIVSTNRITIGETIYQTFEIEVTDKTDEIYKEQQIYSIIFGAYDESSGGLPTDIENPTLSTEFTLNIIPQDVIRMNLNYYSASEIFEYEDDTYYNPNELPSNYIVTGKVGILKIAIYPEFANVDYVDLVYNTNGAFSLSLEQVAFAGDGYTVIYPQSEVITNGIRLRLISNYTGTDYEYDGNLYLKALIASGVTANTEFNLIATTYSLSTGSVAVAGLSGSLTLIAQPASKLDITYESLAQNYIAVGTTHQFVVGVTKMEDVTYSQITFNKTNASAVTYTYNASASAAYNEGNTSYTVYYVFDIYVNPSTYFATPALFRNVITLQAVINKTVNNHVEQYKSNLLKLIPTLFTINSISVDNVLEESLTVAYGSIYELHVNIDADYCTNRTLYSDDINDIETEIANLETTYSNSFSSWYIRQYMATDVVDTVMEAIDYINYSIIYDDALYIQPRRVSSGDNIVSKISYKYDYTLGTYVGIPTAHLVDLSDAVVGMDINEYFTIENEFTTYFYLRSDEDNPIPVYTEEELLDMQEGASYILMSDITLGDTSPWEPLSIEINSFDGNNRTITITNFFDTSNYGEEETIPSNGNFGLFDTITSATTIKNLNVNLTNVIIDATGYLTANIGGLAAINDGGVIYNCNTYSTRDAGEEGITILLNATIGGQTVYAYIGGLVGKNMGYITNSRSELEIISNQGYMAGITAYNSGVIASTYYKNGRITAESPTTASSSMAGFVIFNTVSGQIRTSYVEGITSVEGVAQLEAGTNRILGGGLDFNLNVGGFVYQNNGSITDCYSNIKITSDGRASGFVYINNGTIASSHSMSKLKYNNAAYTPFTGTSDIGGAVQNSGTLTDCYYLDGSFGGEASEPATNVLEEDWGDSTTFSGFSFSSDIARPDDGIWKILDEFDNGIEVPYLVSANQIAVSSQTLVQQTIDEETGEIQYLYVYDAGCDLGSENNPITIKTATRFNSIITEKMGSGTDIFDEYVRIIKDFDFADTTVSQTYNVVFDGMLEGNGMSIGNIRVIASENSDPTEIGLFKEITGTVKNINFDFKQVLANETICVGALAGVIDGGHIYDVTIENADTVIQGRNLVGGLAGKILGNSDIINVNVSISVNSSYRYNINVRDAYNLYVRDVALNDEIISYSGAIAGIMDIVNGHVENLSVTGNTRVIGETVGTAIGLVGSGTIVDGIDVTVQKSQFIRATKIAGGIVGENRGTVKYATIQNVSTVQSAMNANITSRKFGLTVTDQNISFFTGINQAVGGIVGFNNGGTVTYSTSRIDVRNANALVAGGLIGRSTGGSITYSYAYGSVLATEAVGGLMGAATSRTNLTNSTNGYVNDDYVSVVSASSSVVINYVYAYNNWLNTDYNSLISAPASATGIVIGGIAGVIQYSSTTYIYTISKTHNSYINSIYDPASYTSSSSWHIINEYGLQYNGLAISYSASKTPTEVAYNFPYTVSDGDPTTYDNASTLKANGIRVYDLYV